MGGLSDHSRSIPAILTVDKQLLVEGMEVVASEDIFVEICTDIPDY